MSRKDSHGQGLRLLAPGPSDGLPTYKDATTDPDYQDAVNNLCKSLAMMKTKYPNTTFGKVTKDNLTTSFAQGLARLKNSSKHTPNIETAHIAFNRTLRCIGVVGRAAAKDASNALQPAEVCFSAVDIMIKCWFIYDTILEDIIAIWGKACDFMERLPCYGDGSTNMDPQMRTIAVNHLNLFVKICEHSTNMLSRSNRAAEALRGTFFGENTCDALLRQMEGLLTQESRMAQAKIYADAHETKDKVSKIGYLTQEVLIRVNDSTKSFMAWQKQAVEENMGGEMRKVLIRALDVEKNTVRGTEPWENSAKIHRDNKIPETGNWIDKSDALQAWMSCRTNPDASLGGNLIGLEGPTGSGKTFLCLDLAQRLRDPRRNDSTRKIAACVCIDKVDEKDGDGAAVRRKTLQRGPLYMAVESLIWQLATDKAFCKSAGNICEGSHRDGFTDATQMITKLLLKNSEVKDMQADFYLIIDGLTNVMKEEQAANSLAPILRAFKASEFRHKIHIIITGPEKLFSILKRQSTDMLRFPIHEYNSEDIDTFISAKLDSIPNLRDTSRRVVQTLRTKIRAVLRDKIVNNLYRIEDVLETIGKTDQIDEIHKLLDNVEQNRADQVAQEIKLLNKQCSKAEIVEINELVLWVGAAFRWLSPAESEDAIDLRLRTPELRKNGTLSIKKSMDEDFRVESLMPLAVRIEEKYKLFEIVSSLVKFRDDDIHSYIPPKSTILTSNSGNQPIDPGQVKMLRHYLKNVCPQDIYDNFEFDSFFDVKLRAKDRAIFKDPDNCHLHLAMRCAAGLVLYAQEEPKPLLNVYAASHLFDHMKEVNLTKADMELKGSMGKLLMQVFTTPEAIVNLFTSGHNELYKHTENSRPLKRFIPIHWPPWLLCNSGIRLLRDWMQDSDINQWVKGMELFEACFAPKNKLSDKEVGMILFKPAAQYYARLLFLKRQFDVDLLMQQGFLFLRALHLTMDLDAVDSQGDMLWPNLDEMNFWDPTIKDFRFITGYCETLIGGSYTDRSTWLSQMAYIADVTFSCNIRKGFIRHRARDALKENSHNWSAMFTLSQLIFGRAKRINNLEQACEELRIEVAKNPSSEGWSAVIKMLQMIAEFWAHWEWSVGKAAQRFVEMAHVYAQQETAELMIDVIDWLDRNQMYDKAMEIIDAFRTPVDKNIATNEATTTGFIMNHARLAPGRQNKAKLSFNDFFATICSNPKVNLGNALVRIFKHRTRELLDIFIVIGNSLRLQPEPSYMKICQLGYTHAVILSSSLKPDWVKVVTVLDDMLDVNVPKDVEFDKKKALLQIHKLYITACYELVKRVSAQKQHESAQSYKVKITQLYQKITSMGQLDDDVLLAFLRVWFKLESSKRNFFRTRARAYMEILNDDDPWNDYPAYRGLANMFAAFGDRDNLNIAHELMAWDIQKQLKRQPRRQHSAQIPLFQVSVDAPADVDDLSQSYYSESRSATPSGSEVGDSLSVSHEGSVCGSNDGETEYNDTDWGSDDGIPVQVVDYGPGVELVRTYMLDRSPTTWQGNGKPGGNSANEVDDLSNFVGSCCQCAQTVDSFVGMYVCLDCVGNTALHEECRKQVDDGQAYFSTCHRVHEMVLIKERKRAMAELDKEQVLLANGMTITMKQWYERITKEYASDEPPAVPDVKVSVC